MHDHNKHSHDQHGHEHSHHDCCGHEKHTHNEQHEHSHHHSVGADAHKHGHDCCDHDHDHEHKHEHNHVHQHDHAHHHGHDCCDHDHSHGHHHLSSEECSSLVSQAQESNDPAEALDLLLIAGEGFAHLGDAVGTAAVNGLLAKKIPTLQPLSKLKTAQVAALKALELALNKENDKAKTALTQSVSDLEDFTGEDREEVEPLLADVRKQLAGIRTGGLKSLLSKFKF